MRLITRSALFILAAASTTLAKPAIVDGEQAELGEFPYYVQISREFVVNGKIEQTTCGGTLIAPDIVLTAAHCEDDPDLTYYVGAYRRNFLEAVLDDAQPRTCERWVPHPQYVPRGSGLGIDSDNDFALCRLNEPVTIDTTFVSLELNGDENVPANGEDLIVIGLGGTGFETSASNILLEVTVPSITNDQCNEWFPVPNPDSVPRITDNMLCAGFEDSGKGSCRGDSGGPLVRRIDQGDGSFIDMHVGVVSFGRRCDTAGVYARTSAQLAWIKETACDVLGSNSSPLCDAPESKSSKKSSKKSKSTKSTKTTKKGKANTE